MLHDLVPAVAIRAVGCVRILRAVQEPMATSLVVADFGFVTHRTVDRLRNRLAGAFCGRLHTRVTLRTRYDLATVD